MSQSDIENLNKKKEELACLWVKNQASVASFALALVNDLTEADDIVQEVAVEVFRYPERYDPDRSFRSWVLGITRNIAMRHFDNRTRDRHVFSCEVVEMLAESFDVEAEKWSSVQHHLKTCLEKLATKSRELCRLRYENDLPAQLIAEYMQMSSMAVRKALSRTRKALGKCVREMIVMEGTR